MCRVIFLALEELVRRRQARLVAARKAARAAKAASGEHNEQQQQQHGEAHDEKDAVEETDLPAVRVSADHEQQVLTTKGYQQLPSTSLTLNADGLIENVYLLGPLHIHTHTFTLTQHTAHSTQHTRFTVGRAEQQWWRWSSGRGQYSSCGLQLTGCYCC